MAETEGKGSTAVIFSPGYNTGVKTGNCLLTLVRTTSNTMASLGLKNVSEPCTTDVSSLKARWHSERLKFLESTALVAVVEVRAQQT